MCEEERDLRLPSGTEGQGLHVRGGAGFELSSPHIPEERQQLFSK